MPIDKQKFVAVAAKALGRPLPDNLFAKLEACLANERLTYDDLTKAVEVRGKRGVMEVQALDCEVESGTRWRILHISSSFEVVKRGTDFTVRPGYGWERQPTLADAG